jgi:hypothetical protein
MELSQYPSATELTKTGPQIGHILTLGAGIGSAIDHIDKEYVYSGVTKVRSDALEVFVTQRDGGAEWKVADPSAIERIDEGMKDWQLECLGRDAASY